MANLFKKMLATDETMEDEGLEDQTEEVDVEDLVEQPADDSAEGQLAVDVYQTKDDIVIQSTIAGVKPEDLDISIANDMVTVKGHRQKMEEVKADDYFYQECYWGSFSRALALPVEIDVDKARADLKDGVLTLTLPKASRARVKKIKVRGTAEE